MYHDQNDGANHLLTHTTPQPRMERARAGELQRGVHDGTHQGHLLKAQTVLQQNGYDLKSGHERSEAIQSPRYNIELYNDTGNIDQQIA